MAIWLVKKFIKLFFTLNRPLVNGLLVNYRCLVYHLASILKRVLLLFFQKLSIFISVNPILLDKNINLTRVLYLRWCE